MMLNMIVICMAPVYRKAGFHEKTTRNDHQRNSSIGIDFNYCNASVKE